MLYLCWRAQVSQWSVLPQTSAHLAHVLRYALKLGLSKPGGAYAIRSASSRSSHKFFRSFLVGIVPTSVPKGCDSARPIWRKAWYIRGAKQEVINDINISCT